MALPSVSFVEFMISKIIYMYTIYVYFHTNLFQHINALIKDCRTQKSYFM